MENPYLLAVAPVVPLLPLPQVNAMRELALIRLGSIMGVC